MGNPVVTLQMTRKVILVTPIRLEPNISNTAGQGLAI